MTAAVRRPPYLLILLLALMLWQAYENALDIRGLWGTLPGSNVLVVLQVAAGALAIALVVPLWRRERRAVLPIRVYCALVIAQATTAATIFAAGDERLPASLGAFGGATLIMLGVATATVRWLRSGESRGP